MPLPVIPNMVQVAITYGPAAWFCTNVLNCDTAEDDLQVIAAAVADGWYLENSIATLQSNDVDLIQVAVTPFDGASGATVFSPAEIGNEGSTGVVASAPVSPQVAGVITWRTGLGGRSFRGRSYVGGFGQLAVDEVTGTVATGSQDEWSAAPGVFMGAIGTFAGIELVVLSLIEDGVERESPLANVVTSYVSRNAMRTQRRRASRVG